MADSSLSVGTNTGGQDTSAPGSLQAPAGFSSEQGRTNDFQPVVSGEELKSNQGISLTPTALSTVDLSQTSASSVTAQIQPTKHHINGVFLGFCLVLFAVAVFMFVVINQSSKKHNQY